MSSKQLSRMISFRLSPEEYDHCRQICHERGMVSVSEVARLALTLLFQRPGGKTLESRLTHIEQRLDDLSSRVESKRRVKAIV